VKSEKFLGYATIKMNSHSCERMYAANALERTVYGDLFSVVLNTENRNNSTALNYAKELLRPNS